MNYISKANSLPLTSVKLSFFNSDPDSDNIGNNFLIAKYHPIKNYLELYFDMDDISFDSVKYTFLQ